MKSKYKLKIYTIHGIISGKVMYNINYFNGDSRNYLDGFSTCIGININEIIEGTDAFYKAILRTAYDIGKLGKSTRRLVRCCEK